MITRDDSRYIHLVGPTMSYSSRRHKRNCRYNGCPFSLFIRQQIYFSCSSPCEDRSPTIVEVNREQCNLVFLRISRPFLPQYRCFSLSFADYLGGHRWRHESTVFNHPCFFFLFFFFFCKIFFHNVACSFERRLSTSLTNVPLRKVSS